MTTTAKTVDSQNTEKKARTCRFYYSWHGCRDGEDCLYKHTSDAPACKYYTSRWGCWNGKYCRFRHEDEDETATDTVKQFYSELNHWLGPNKIADDSPRAVAPPADSLPVPDVGKKLVSRGTQTNPVPDFVHCGECGEEFKSGRTCQQSLERHYIYKLASADFQHLRFFKNQPELRRNDPFCSACGEVFGSIESLLQHMGSRVSFSTTSASVRQEHQSWFKHLVQPFVYRDLEVLETKEMIQRIVDVYFIKANGNTKPKPKPKQKASPAVPAKAEPEALPKSPSPSKFARKLQEHLKANTSSKVSPYVHCEECGEIFDYPGGDEKLHLHYADMLTRADPLHVWLLREQGNIEAHCSACKKIFLSPIALMQHLGSKQRMTGSNPRPSVVRHTRLLSDIADIFVGHDLGMEGYSTEKLGTKLLEIIAPHSLVTNGGTEEAEEGADSPFKDNPEDSLHMARYFCRVNEWQAKMSYSDYVKDDQERTRNHGFTIAEVEYLKSRKLTPMSRGVFSVLNALYRGRRDPIKSSSRSSSVREDGTKSSSKATRKGSQEKDVDEKDEDEDASKEKPKKKRVRRRRRVLSSDQLDEQDQAKDNKRNARKSSGKKIEDNESKIGNEDTSKIMKTRVDDVEVMPKVVFEVRMDGVVFIRTSAIEEEEVVSTKDNSMLRKVVEHSLHVDKAAALRMYVVHDDGTIDINIASSYSDEHNEASSKHNTETSIAEMYIKKQEIIIAEINPQDILTTPTTGHINPQETFAEDTSAITSEGNLDKTFTVQRMQQETPIMCVSHEDTHSDITSTQTGLKEAVIKTKVQEMITASSKSEEVVANPAKIVATLKEPVKGVAVQSESGKIVDAAKEPAETATAVNQPVKTVTMPTETVTKVAIQTKPTKAIAVLTEQTKTVSIPTKPVRTVTKPVKTDAMSAKPAKTDAMSTKQAKTDAMSTKQAKTDGLPTKQAKTDAVPTKQAKTDAVPTKQAKTDAVATNPAKTKTEREGMAQADSKKEAGAHTDDKETQQGTRKEAHHIE